MKASKRQKTAHVSEEQPHVSHLQSVPTDRDAEGDATSLLESAPQEPSGVEAVGKLSAKERKRLARKAEKEIRKSKKVKSAQSEADQNVTNTSEDIAEAKKPVKAVQSSDEDVRTTSNSKHAKSSKKRKRNEDPTTDQAKKNLQNDNETNGHVNGEDRMHEKNAPRFIAFIGNLPFGATTTTIEQHFQSLAPFAIRPMTDKKTKKFKGCAFIEFQSYDKMESCLRLFHHSKFKDEKGTERKINVELTAGGGGKSGARMQKIKAKNTKLQEERKRKVAGETEEKRKRLAATTSGPNAEALGEPGKKLEDAVHPSRRARVNG